MRFKLSPNKTHDINWEPRRLLSLVAVGGTRNNLCLVTLCTVDLARFLGHRTKQFGRTFVRRSQRQGPLFQPYFVLKLTKLVSKNQRTFRNFEFNFEVYNCVASYEIKNWLLVWKPQLTYKTVVSSPFSPNPDSLFRDFTLLSVQKLWTLEFER